jgi:putative toxin-antitoxin system antitoxin component (TIGR02293 family)
MATAAATLFPVVKRELSFAAYRKAVALLGISETDGGRLFSIAPRTLDRRRQAGCLSATEADRVDRALRIFREAAATFRSNARAQVWLHRPSPDLDNRAPISLLGTDAGAVEVERLIGRIERGVY